MQMEELGGMGLDWHTVIVTEDGEAINPCGKMAKKKLKDGLYFDEWVEKYGDAECGEEWSCDGCSLLEALKGEKMITGIMAKSCDFRGRIVANHSLLSQELRAEAYQAERTPEEMLDYADRLEMDYKKNLKKNYKKFLKDGNFHPDESDVVDLRGAVYWLRTCAELGVHMKISF